MNPRNWSCLNDYVKLPSMAWSWESMWYLDTNHEGKSLGKDGWTYAVDFPAEYHPKKTFTSCVRRRKWIRYRKYVATDSWSGLATNSIFFCFLFVSNHSFAWRASQ